MATLVNGRDRSQDGSPLVLLSRLVGPYNGNLEA